MLNQESKVLRCSITVPNLGLVEIAGWRVVGGGIRNGMIVTGRGFID